MESVVGLLMSSPGKWVTAKRYEMWPLTCWPGACCTSVGCGERVNVAFLFPSGSDSIREMAMLSSLGTGLYWLCGALNKPSSLNSASGRRSERPLNMGVILEYSTGEAFITKYSRYYLCGSPAPRCFALPLNCRKGRQHISPVSY